MAKKILCIEDDQAVSELYVRALEHGGYEMTIERDGKRGLELAQTDDFDIILLDLMLPNLSGSDVLQALRDPAQTPHLHSKVIIITNLEQRPEVRAAIERQADAYLVKAEITPKQLVEFLNNIVLS